MIQQIDNDAQVMVVEAVRAEDRFSSLHPSRRTSKVVVNKSEEKAKLEIDSPRQNSK